MGTLWGLNGTAHAESECMTRQLGLIIISTNKTTMCESGPKAFVLSTVSRDIQIAGATIFSVTYM